MSNVSSAVTLIGTLSKLELESLNVGFWGEGKTRVPGEKPLGAEKRTQLTYDAGSRNRTQDTLVGDEGSYHCVNPDPMTEDIIKKQVLIW